MALSIERLAWGGLGISRDPEGRLILVRAPLALFPGEEVRATVGMKARHGEGEVLDWLHTSPSRIDPECPVAKTCGGCELWGAGPEEGGLKRAMVADLLQRQLPGAPAWSWHPAPAHARRHRIQLHWDGTSLGFHRRKSHAVVPVSRCPVAEPALSDAIPLLGDALASGQLPRRPQRWELTTGTPASAIWAVDSQGKCWSLRDLNWVPSEADEAVLHALPSGDLAHRPGGFFQVCAPWALEALHHLILDWDLRGQTLHDLYGGVGLFSALTGPRFQHRILVEVDEAATAYARKNLESLGLPAQCHAQDVGTWLPEGLGTAEDLIVLDPPRAGLDPAVAARLQSSNADRLLLMGCDGAAFCRDAKRLAPQWQLTRLAILDLFPKTHHVECVGLFTAARG